MLRRLRKGQSTAEYAIVIGLVLAAAIAMQVYVKRGIQGKSKDASDANIVYKGIPGGKDSDTDYGVNLYNQFEPQYSISPLMTTTQNSRETTTVNQGGGVKRDIIGNEISSRTGTQEILAPDSRTPPPIL